MKLLRLHCLAVALLFVVGCDNTPLCIPGSPIDCTPCPTGAAGYRVCEPAGLQYGECLCGALDMSVPDGPAAGADLGVSLDSSMDGP
jgi:hypothetical protein